MCVARVNKVWVWRVECPKPFEHRSFLHRSTMSVKSATYITLYAGHSWLENDKFEWDPKGVFPQYFKNDQGYVSVFLFHPFRMRTGSITYSISSSVFFHVALTLLYFENTVRQRNRDVKS